MTIDSKIYYAHRVDTQVPPDMVRMHSIYADRDMKKSHPLTSAPLSVLNV